MSSETMARPVPESDVSYSVAGIGMEQPWQWLANAARDFRHAPLVSLAYGSFWVGVSILLTAGLVVLDMAYWLLPLAAGFMFLGPLVATGLYEISRDMEAGRQPGLRSAFQAWRRNPVQIALMGLVLMIFMLAWTRLALLMFALFFGVTTPSPEILASEIFFSLPGLGLLITGCAIGALLAFGAFAISAVSIPMLLDRNVSVLEAIVASLSAVHRNLMPLIVWGLLLTAFTIAGIATLYIGLAVVLPLLGYASWYAYRDLIQYDDTPPAGGSS
ncbi:DUF2189 domain-containing protein [Methylonatrum kenyense]|uniref:DUF2189 domain-containing protein n=1 Tax=Methylonatrum kenyense TaxID=455253 RepID=UPI0020BDD9B7|nr:DUF2189 domain-containing protein [Methylonatrum kenyense]MCK8516351.1 DUF2189 domain-containing protein [Methylonatrum kenyense]